MEWLLVISALAFAAGATSHPLLHSLVYLSLAAFGVHTVFVLPERFARSFPQIPKAHAPLWRRVVRFGVAMTVVGALLFGAFRLSSLAGEIAAGLAVKIGG